MGDIDHAADRLLQLTRRIAEGAAGREDGNLHLAVGALGQFLAPGHEPVAVHAVPGWQEMAELEFDLLRRGGHSKTSEQYGGQRRFADGWHGPLPGIVPRRIFLFVT